MEKKGPPIIKIDLSKDFSAAIGSAADILLSGGVVAFPTETFYGLAVDIRNEAAIRRLFTVKERSADRPVLILIGSADSLDHYAAHIPPIAHRLIREFWPGDLTLVFRAGQAVSPLLTSGTQKIGIRLSSHPVATAMAQAIGGAISGTSANISNQPASRNAQGILENFGNQVNLILDAGETAGKVGSTVLDVTTRPLQLLREGVIPKRRLIEQSFDIA